MNQVRQKLINMVKGEMSGYWIEHLVCESDNKDYYLLRNSADCPPLLCYPIEGIRLRAIKSGLSDEEIDSLQIREVNPSEKGKCLAISLDEMICIDKWSTWARDGKEDRDRYKACLESIAPEHSTFF